MQCILQRYIIPLKEAQLAFMFESSTKTKIESAASFESYTMFSTPFLWKYVAPLSKNSSCAVYTGTGTPFI